MTIDEFEIQVRDAIDTALNQLQTVSLLVTQLEIQNSAAGTSLQDLSHLLEEFITEERSRQM